MSDDGDDAEKGLSEAHTPRGPAPAAPELPPRDQIGAAVAALAGAIDADEGDQLDLLTGSPDLEPVDTLGAIAETSNAQRRARGRPKGSANKRNTAVFEYLEALGHRDPAVTLSILQSADTIALAKALGEPLRDSKGNLIRTPARDHDGTLLRDAEGELVMEVVYAMADPVKVAQLQRQAAADLMPFKYAKKPLAVELPPGKPRPFMMIGEMNVQQNNVLAVMSAGGEYEGFQALSDDATVRPQDGESHEDAETLDAQRVEQPRATD